jgi:hypothetical protein
MQREREKEKERKEKKIKMEQELQRDRKKEEENNKRNAEMLGIYALSAGSPEVNRKWASKLDVPPVVRMNLSSGPEIC